DAGRFVPGYEPAGVVVEAASDVDQGLIGRKVVLHSHESCGNCRYCNAGADNLCGKMRVFGVGTPGAGGWSEEVVVSASRVLPLLDNVDVRGACTYEVTYGTALHSLRRGISLVELPGPVAVRGMPGGVALAAAQFCVAMDVPCVAIVRNPEGQRAHQLRELLPQIAVVGEADGNSAVFEAFHAPAALVIEPLGGKYLAADVDIVARGGAIGVVGTHIGVTSTLRADALFMKGVTVYGTPRAPIETMNEVARMVAESYVTPVIDRVYPMSDAALALEYCENPTGIGRVLLSMNSAADCVGPP
ncbi:MAG TPA: alcohol dehydrogenase catalytic domain-containing protein, partial [Acidimicrobiales bacterium]|nr:alcohol dehydrogenase catalytic domain-containing protein [Acidimicrobiales bacterium]